MRLRATIEKVDGPVYLIKNRDGAEMKLTLTGPPLYVAIVKSTMADIKPGMFVGAAKKQPDGTWQTPRITYGKDGLTPPM